MRGAKSSPKIFSENMFAFLWEPGAYRPLMRMILLILGWHLVLLGLLTAGIGLMTENFP